jgi:hypothetical protein
VVVKVSDNGYGMNEDVMENIFIPFFSTKKNGSGIGLSLCKQIMMLHKGNITPQSVEGKGTDFPDKGGNKKPLDSYTAVSSTADEILRRIQLAPTDRGFMPNRKPKLSDSTINVIKQWKADGLTEK